MNFTKQISTNEITPKTNTEKERSNPLFSTKSLVTMALFAAVLCVSAYISVALPNGMHVTFLNFVSTLIALVFPWQQSFLIVLVWILMGSVGIPVFIGGNAGIGYLLSALGGYTLAFLAVSFFVPLLCGKKYNRIRYTIIAVLSVIFVDVAGMLQLMFLQGLTLKQAIIPGFLSFIVLDLIKAVVAAQIAPAFRNVIASIAEV